ncbi:growth hormone secretagogue receptor type 1-like [Centropristis striata]|uniref:growth hormone secretagogue receptor type 1-like n=1 Tax=Centropristis striata TaxID=184440 RepID=UPI0027E1230B|nr:growth hormone secretagogue receptor type 1-like [Centropristis striata]
MDLMELGDFGSGCEDETCGLAPGFQEDCSNQECYWEEPVFGLIELVCVTVIYIPLMLFGLLGNILTILVVWLRPHMRSSTYLYLSSMAVSDLLILLLLPLDLYKLWRPRPWPLGDLACKLTMFLSECCTFCTILHITFLSLERYLAVCWPITAKTLVTRSRTRALIGCLWLSAVISAAPVLVMVGVEDVGGGEQGLGGVMEDGGWMGREGEQGGFMMDRKERGSGHMVSVDGVSEGIKWEEKGQKEAKGWGERVGEFKWLGEKAEIEVGIQEKDKRKQGEEGKNKLEKQADEGGGEGKMDIEGEQQNKMREDEGGGGGEGGVDGGEIDMSECRCTHYAASSGLLSAMMILSNLYFLVPVCILGLVYSLIGRTLWLRPQSSRRDQSHRHTVKMLGVIVLAFVLCWLPFHVGRTIFFFSFDRQEAYTDINSNLETLSDNRNNSTHTVTEAQNTQTLNNMQDNRLYIDNTHNDTHFNNTYTHPDTHLYFLYYLSQYFNLVSSVLFYLSAAVNPLLYNLMSARYRHAVHSLTHTHSHTQSHRLRTITTRHSTTTL